MSNIIYIHMGKYRQLVSKLEAAHEELCDAIVTRIPIINDYPKSIHPSTNENYTAARDIYEALLEEIDTHKKKLMDIEASMS